MEECHSTNKGARGAGPVGLVGKPPLTDATSHIRGARQGQTLTYQFLDDDRMAAMTYIAVKEPDQIGDPDWIRLGLQDEPGPHDQFPFSTRFHGNTPGQAVRAFERDYCYDRHFARQGDSYACDDLRTRYLCSGMGFVAVGSSKAKSRSVDGVTIKILPFGIDSISGLLGYFRYHYFKLALIAHFHRATLLNLEGRLAEAIDELRGDPGGTTEKFAQAISEEGPGAGEGFPQVSMQFLVHGGDRPDAGPGALRQVEREAAHS